MTHEATGVLYDPRLIHRVAERAGEVFIREVGTQQRISTRVVTEAFPHPYYDRVNVARLEWAHVHAFTLLRGV
jgi:hypothetical protein